MRQARRGIASQVEYDPRRAAEITNARVRVKEYEQGVQRHSLLWRRQVRRKENILLKSSDVSIALKNV